MYYTNFFWRYSIFGLSIKNYFRIFEIELNSLRTTYGAENIFLLKKLSGNLRMVERDKNILGRKI